MLRLRGLFKKQAELILASRKQATLYAVILALLPYCTWFAMVVIALVTLRKGQKEGARILVTVMLVHGSLLSTAMPLYAVICNMFLVFVPVYVAAYVLRAMSSWQAVGAVLFFLVILSSVFIQQMVPEWVMSQYAMFQSIVQASQSEHVLTKWLDDATGVPALAMANYTLGIQLMSAVLSVWSALLLARSLQSQLFYPGGFKQELMTFRGNRLSFIVMLLLCAAAWQWNVVAMNVLPVLVVFYLLAGLSLCANFFMGKLSRGTLVVLILPVLFIPFVMLPLYIILGVLDSVFNIRLAFFR
ncbi:MAG: hypothetical protein NTU48_08035 [Legionellales bacterium]|nr:hypothetical protein [Legionellales bacterium]